MPAGEAFDAVRDTVREHRLATVCEEAKCPNIGECWNAGTATHHADGRGVHARLPLLRGRHRQSARLARCRGARERRAHRRAHGLKYIVLTSVNRDDLPTAARRTSRRACARSSSRTPQTAVEALTPDFQGVLARRRDGRRQRPRGVRAERRDGAAPDASGARSARGLRADARACSRTPSGIKPDVLTKTSLMLGLGETGRRDRRRRWTTCARSASTCSRSGQYLRPTMNHLAGASVS